MPNRRPGFSFNAATARRLTSPPHGRPSRPFRANGLRGREAGLPGTQGVALGSYVSALRAGLTMRRYVWLVGLLGLLAALPGSSGEAQSQDQLCRRQSRNGVQLRRR